MLISPKVYQLARFSNWKEEKTVVQDWTSVSQRKLKFDSRGYGSHSIHRTSWAMRRPNLSTLVILASSLLVIHLIGLINSSLGPWGFYLYLPGLFFLAPTVHLERFRATLVIVIIGFSLDLQNNTPFGFHATALIIFHFNWNRMGADWETERERSDRLSCKLWLIF